MKDIVADFHSVVKRIFGADRILQNKRLVISDISLEISKLKCFISSVAMGITSIDTIIRFSRFDWLIFNHRCCRRFVMCGLEHILKTDRNCFPLALVPRERLLGAEWWCLSRGISLPKISYTPGKNPTKSVKVILFCSHLNRADTSHDCWGEKAKFSDDKIINNNNSKNNSCKTYIKFMIYASYYTQ